MIHTASLYRSLPLYARLSVRKKANIFSSVLGFTLIELMIALVIVAILAVVGTNQYFDYIRDSRISMAQQYLTDIASFQERYYLDHKKYQPRLPSSFKSLPPEIRNDYSSPEVHIGEASGEPEQFVIVLRPNNNSAIMNSFDNTAPPFSVTLAVNSEYQRWYERDTCTCASGGGCTYDAARENSWNSSNSTSTTSSWGSLSCRTKDGTCTATAKAPRDWTCTQ